MLEENSLKQKGKQMSYYNKEEAREVRRIQKLLTCEFRDEAIKQIARQTWKTPFGRLVQELKEENSTLISQICLEFVRKYNDLDALSQEQKVLTEKLAEQEAPKKQTIFRVFKYETDVRLDRKTLFKTMLKGTEKQIAIQAKGLILGLKRQHEDAYIEVLARGDEGRVFTWTGSDIL